MDGQALQSCSRSHDGACAPPLPSPPHYPHPPGCSFRFFFYQHCLHTACVLCNISHSSQETRRAEQDAGRQEYERRLAEVRAEGLAEASGGPNQSPFRRVQRFLFFAFFYRPRRPIGCGDVAVSLLETDPFKPGMFPIRSNQICVGFARIGYASDPLDLDRSYLILLLTLTLRLCIGSVHGQGDVIVILFLLLTWCVLLCVAVLADGDGIVVKQSDS